MESIKIQDEPLQKRRKLSENIESFTTIDNLNDYCLIQIFNILPIPDRLRVERVCKRWQEVGKDSWSKLKELDFHPKNLGLKPYGRKHQYPVINEYTIKNLLERSGKYLDKITITQHFTIDYGFLVAEFCKNVQSVTLDKISIKGLEKLTDNCKNIAELTINSCSLLFIEQPTRGEEVLGKLFSNNKNLRILKIGDFGGYGECLLRLPLEEIEEINIIHGSSYPCYLVKNLPNVICKF